MAVLRVSDLTVVGGVVLVAASFLPWYGVDTGPFLTSDGRGSSSANMWQAPAWWVPVLAGVVVSGLWVARRLRRIEGRWLPAVTFALGLAGLVLIGAQWLQGAPLGSGSEDFGWYAYSPLTANVPDFAAGPRPGLVLGLTGLVLQTAAAASWLREAGRRGRSARPV